MNDYDYAWSHGWAAYLNGAPAIYPEGVCESTTYLGWHAGYSDARMLHEAIGYNPRRTIHAIRHGNN